MKAQGPWGAVLALGYALVAVLLLWPLANVLWLGVTREGGAAANSIWSDRSLWVACGNSLVVSSLGALGALALGLPLALLTARVRIPGSGALAALATLCLLSPPFVGAYAWILLLGQAGVLRAWLSGLGIEAPEIYGPLGIVIVFASQYFPLVFLLTRSALQNQDPSLDEAARSLGASAWTRLWRVTLPLALPSLSGGALLAFVMALANFGTPQVLGRGYRVLPTLAYDRFTSESARDPGAAAQVCLLMILLAGAALALQRYLARRREVQNRALRRTEPRALPGWRGLLAAASAWGIVLAALAPLGVVVATSFRNTRGPVFEAGLGLTSYRAVSHGLTRAIGNSLVYSFAAAFAIALVGALLGVALARRRGLLSRVLDALLLLPYLIPGLVLGIGFALGFQRAPAWLSGSGAVLVLAYLIRRLPYAVRSNAELLEQLDPALEEAAQSLGATPWRAFTQATLPLLTPAVVTGAVLGWVTSIGELSATIVLHKGSTVTMPVQIYRHVIDGDLGPAAALSTLLLAATGLALVVIERVRVA